MIHWQNTTINSVTGGEMRHAACNRNYLYRLASGPDVVSVTCPECRRKLKAAQTRLNYGAIGIATA